MWENTQLARTKAEIERPGDIEGKVKYYNRKPRTSEEVETIKECGKTHKPARTKAEKRERRGSRVDKINLTQKNRSRGVQRE